MLFEPEWILCEGFHSKFVESFERWILVVFWNIILMYRNVTTKASYKISQLINMLRTMDEIQPYHVQHWRAHIVLKNI